MAPASIKQKIAVVMVLVVVLFMFEYEGVSGAGECGRVSSPDREAMKLAPCMSSAPRCGCPCFKQLLRSGAEDRAEPDLPLCSHASNMATAAGIKPEVVVTIPKRCNLVDRPVGYQCGSYMVP